MVEPSEISSDLTILIAQTWNVATDDSIDIEAICRIWAYDLGWFDISKSQIVRDNLIDTGWLEVHGSNLIPGFNIEGIEIPFSWMPAMRILENPPILEKRAQNVPSEDIMKEEEIVEPDSKQTPNLETPIDPAAAQIKPLLEQISNISRMDVKEIMRRAQRKRKALGPVTLWMALLLVAREQRLSIPELIHTIALY